MDFSTYIDKRDRGLTSLSTTEGVSILTFLKFDQNTGEKVLDESTQIEVANVTATIAEVQQQAQAYVTNLQALKDDLL